MQTGIQISSLKPLIQTGEDLRATCAKVAALGSDTVQLQWLGRDLDGADVARVLAHNGVRSVSVQDFYQLIQDDFEYYVNLNGATGGKWLCVSRIPEELKSPEGLDIFVSQLRAMQEALDDYGQKLCLHPVSADFHAVAGMDAVGYVLEQYPELDLCLDLYHLNRCCGDMPGFIRRYAGRIPMVHFKDGKDGKLVPAGQGDVSWDGVVKACLDAGVEYGFVEQESWDRDPFVCLKEAMDWLDQELKK